MAGEEPKRAGTASDRDVLVPKHSPTPPKGIVYADDLTPPPISVPDEIEIAANRIQKRHETIQKRPGNSPSPEAVSTAITIHAVRSELKLDIAEVKTTFTRELGSVKENVAGLTSSITGLAGILPGLVDDLATERAQRREEEHLAATAKIAMEAHKERTAIDDAADRKRNLRRIVKGVTIGLVSIAGTLATAYAAGSLHC